MWVLPASDGGSPVTSYRVQAWSKQTKGALLGECVSSASAEASAGTCTVTGQRNFEPIWVQVQARNARGYSPAGARVSYEPKPAVPSAPERVQVRPGANGLSVSWSHPTSDGGYPIFSYTAQAFDAPTGGRQLGQCTSAVSRRAALTAPPTPACAITGLPSDGFVYVDVVAENTVGNSTPSARVASPVTFVP
jgi:hypothetical protein